MDNRQPLKGNSTNYINFYSDTLRFYGHIHIKEESSGISVPSFCIQEVPKIISSGKRVIPLYEDASGVDVISRVTRLTLENRLNYYNNIGTGRLYPVMLSGTKYLIGCGMIIEENYIAYMDMSTINRETLTTESRDFVISNNFFSNMNSFKKKVLECIMSTPTTERYSNQVLENGESKFRNMPIGIKVVPPEYMYINRHSIPRAIYLKSISTNINNILKRNFPIKDTNYDL